MKKQKRTVPVIIDVDGELTEVLPANGKKFALKELQEIVGGSIQLVRAKDGCWLVVDESGRLKEKPINDEATLLWEYGSLNPGDWLLRTHDFVVGRALICPKKFM